MRSSESIFFLNGNEIQEMLDEDSETIANLTETKVLLSLRLATGEEVFPEFQFKNGSYFPELIVLSQKFPKEFSGWDVTCWFYAWNDNLKAYPVTMLQTKEDRDKLALAITVETDLLAI